MDDGNSIRDWFLFSANRLTVTGVLTVACFGLLTVFSALDIPLESILADGDTIETLFQTLVGVLITGMTLVVSINQLVLSEEFGSLGRQRERMDKSMAFRKDSEREFQWTGPPEPERFLSTLINTSVDRARAVREAVDGNDDRLLRERVDQLVDRIAASADEITDELEDAPFGEFTIMRAALSYNYSWKIYLVRRLYWEHQESIDDETRAAIDDLVDILQLFGPAEEFFKAHYLQWELVNLSRRILVTGIPALILSIYAALYLKPEIVSGTVLGVPAIVWLINGGVTIALIPFFIFTAYVLRTASIAKESGAIGPFVLHESERAPLIDWGE
ncbi:hypothetical protein [Halopiger xanaduensis]|uniref:Uncharacterized protein n=1 Tax=Halopiger xanaduensis (strain DSM 18323 / JCM 14033 / SH-6) TaxID=797210 RepID=F8D5C0_HALXS|nr:hypothetical protein [Halopiger xanaduensis]AEH37619.1 hypothetical protein Halxa_3003 [Halopiger xanaduensis SH-6]